MKINFLERNHGLRFKLFETKHKNQSLDSYR